MIYSFEFLSALKLIGPCLLSHQSIPSAFADGKSLEETFDAIAKREIRKRDLPMIDVVWKDGAYWSLSNRRLAVFSELERRGLAKQV